MRTLHIRMFHMPRFCLFTLLLFSLFSGCQKTTTDTTNSDVAITDQEDNTDLEDIAQSDSDFAEEDISTDLEPSSKFGII